MQAGTSCFKTTAPNSHPPNSPLPRGKRLNEGVATRAKPRPREGGHRAKNHACVCLYICVLWRGQVSLQAHLAGEMLLPTVLTLTLIGHGFRTIEALGH